MKLQVPYGKNDKLPLEVPDRNIAAVLYPNEVDAREPTSEIRFAFEHAIASIPLSQFLSGEGNILFIVNDATRPTPTASVLDEVERTSDLSKFNYIVATGAHRAPTPFEYEAIFGPRYEKLRNRITAHDSRRSPSVNLGRSTNGTEMLVNEAVAKADKLVIITSVEPHYFAGYTGGRKSILPGVAAHRTIEQNHRLAMREEARVLKLDGNPVHEDMIDALRCLEGKKIFAIQMVLDRHHHIYRVVAGDLHASFAKAVEFANQVFCAPIEEKADVVISIAPHPMDIDLYQSQKALDNAKFALKDGGTLILVSECRDGVGDRTFYDALARSPDPQEVIRELDKEYKLGYHKAAKMAEIMTRAKICGVTSLKPDELKRIRIWPFISVQAALDAALSERPEAKVIVMFEGSVLVPRLVRNG